MKFNSYRSWLAEKFGGLSFQALCTREGIGAPDPNAITVDPEAELDGNALLKITDPITKVAGTSRIFDNGVGGDIRINSDTNHALMGDTEGVGNSTAVEVLDEQSEIRLIAAIDLDLQTPSVKVQSVQVLTTQQPLIANATDAPSAITQINAILAALRTHGIIAT